jgi:hypothetical protein
MRSSVRFARNVPVSQYDRPLRRQHDAAVPCELQRLGELLIAEKTEVGIVERGFRDDEHVPEAAAGPNKKDLGGSVKCEEIAMGDNRGIRARETHGQIAVTFIEGRPGPSAVSTHG